jgi:serine protease Do
LQKREARLGVHPNDLLPFDIFFVTDLLEIIPFELPIPFRTEGISLGSGFLINDGGYILTNAHVVHNATDIRVVRAGLREEYPAKIVGIDRLTDTALLRIAPRPGMATLDLGHSDSARVGEMVVAVGNPLGLNHTVTSGLVSAKERIIPGADAQILDYLQTDSAINPGSSGGPLLNLRGEVVGINTAMVAQAQSIGFAIPIDAVKAVMPLLVLGRTERGWLGASVRPLRPGEPDAAHGGGGVVVLEVREGSPAEDAGLVPGDRIIAVEESGIADFIRFRRALLAVQPGQSLRLSVVRADERLEITSRLASHPDS